MTQRVGTCSLCGGDVMGYRGMWHSILPPPPDHCASCWAVSASDVVAMRRIPVQAFPLVTRTDTRTAVGQSWPLLPNTTTTTTLNFVNFKT